MEPPEGAPAEGASDFLFSDQIRLWLDEGDRLDAESGSAPAMGAAADPGPFRRALRGLREQAARHRMTVMAGFGLLPLALFAAIHHGAPPPSIATVAVVAAATPAPPPPVAPQREASSSRLPPVAAAPVAAPPPGAAPAPVLASKVRPAKLHHHHHHRLAQRADSHRH